MEPTGANGKEQPAPVQKEETKKPQQPVPVESPELVALQRNLHDKINKLEESLTSMITPLQNSMSVLLELKEAWQEGLQECKAVKVQNVKLSTRLEKVEADNKALTARVVSLENKLFEHSVVLQGFPEDAWEHEATTKEQCLVAISHTIEGIDHNDKMEKARRIPIKEVYRKGRYRTEGKRPVILEFHHKNDVEYLLQMRKKLPAGVYVDCQYTEETESERCKLQPIIQAARKHPEFKGKCRMDGATLIIKGRNFNTSNLHQLPKEINGFHATSKSNGNTLGFFGELNPLSNFHQSSFKVDGVTYHSSKQFIQYQKSQHFNDLNASQSIMAATTSLQCKHIARDITNYNHESWKQAAKTACMPGILAKFTQNQYLGELLKSTESQKIVECSRDKFWGTGTPLHDDSALNEEFWHSQGILGKILEEVRQKLRDQMDTSETPAEDISDPPNLT